MADVIVDRYTKTVLTVIAGCLLWICAMGAGQSVGAQRAEMVNIPNVNVQPVVVVGTGFLDRQGTVTVNFVDKDGARRTDPTLPVQLPYSSAKPLPVSLPYTPANPLPARLGYATRRCRSRSVRSSRWETGSRCAQESKTRRHGRSRAEGLRGEPGLRRRRPTNQVVPAPVPERLKLSSAARAENHMTSPDPDAIGGRAV
jgi:hypothetical protein